jgi:hypothetical protein
MRGTSAAFRMGLGRDRTRTSCSICSTWHCKRNRVKGFPVPRTSTASFSDLAALLDADAVACVALCTSTPPHHGCMISIAGSSGVYRGRRQKMKSSLRTSCRHRTQFVVPNGAQTKLASRLYCPIVLYGLSWARPAPIISRLLSSHIVRYAHPELAKENIAQAPCHLPFASC